MDVIFNCPKCQQQLEVDAGGAAQEIDCPACGETITIPEPDSPTGSGEVRLAPNRSTRWRIRRGRRWKNI